jgi:hypothetical protein
MNTISLTNTETLVLIITHVVGLAVLVALAGYLLGEILSRATRGVIFLWRSLCNALDRCFNTMVDTSMHRVKESPKKPKRVKKVSKVLKSTKRAKK